MTEFQIVDEKPISLSNLHKHLNELADEEALTFRGEKTKAYLESFSSLEEVDQANLKEQIVALEIPRLKERHIVKILDLMPKDVESLKIIFSGETLTINDDDLKKILDVIPQ